MRARALFLTFFFSLSYSLSSDRDMSDGRDIVLTRGPGIALANDFNLEAPAPVAGSLRVRGVATAVAGIKALLRLY
jgi:hypothetical protein